MTDFSFEERFALIVDRQWTWKEDRRMKRLLSNAKLKINGCVEDIDYKTPRGIDKSVAHKGYIEPLLFSLYGGKTTRHASTDN